MPRFRVSVRSYAYAYAYAYGPTPTRMTNVVALLMQDYDLHRKALGFFDHMICDINAGDSDLFSSSFSFGILSDAPSETRYLVVVVMKNLGFKFETRQFLLLP